MFYLISSIVLFGLIFFIEFKRSENSYKFNDGCSLAKAIKSNFSVVKFICIPLLFVSLVMVFIIKLEKGGLLPVSSEEFHFSLLPYVIYSSFIIPFIEEYFYRFLPYSFKKYKNTFVYGVVIILSSLLFTCFHKVDTLASLFIFLMAIIFSLIYLKTRNITYCMESHGLYNLVTLIRSYTGFSNAGVFMIVFLVTLFVLVVYNERKKLRR